MTIRRIASEVRQGLTLEPLSRRRVLERQGGGVQHQPGRHAQSLFVGVHVAAQDGMPQLAHVNAQLVRAASDRFQDHPRAIGLALDHAVAGQGVLAALVTDHLPGAILPIAGNGQVDLALVFSHDTVDHRGIGLFDLALLELAADMGVGRLVQGNDHDARGVQVQPMHDAGTGVVHLQAGDEAVLVQGVAAGDAQEQVGFTHQQQVGVLVEDAYLFLAVGHQVGGLVLHGGIRDVLRGRTIPHLTQLAPVRVAPDRYNRAAMNTDIDILQQRLGDILPFARLQQMALPGCGDLQLLLLNADYPQGELDGEQVQRIMDNPLYWVFCWASGQVLAEYIMQTPALVEGKRVLDFGCGSGVVAIAAALAGAAQVIACDIDELAMTATRCNARLNGVDLVYAGDYDDVAGELDLILVADVLYDRGNLPWLDRFAARAPQVLVADSRVKDFDYPPYRQVARSDSCTIPDLDESAEFRDVRLYLAGNLPQ